MLKFTLALIGTTAAAVANPAYFPPTGLPYDPLLASNPYDPLAAPYASPYGLADMEAVKKLMLKISSVKNQVAQSMTAALGRTVLPEDLVREFTLLRGSNDPRVATSIKAANRAYLSHIGNTIGLTALSNSLNVLPEHRMFIDRLVAAFTLPVTQSAAMNDDLTIFRSIVAAIQLFESIHRSMLARGLTGL